MLIALKGLEEVTHYLHVLVKLLVRLSSLLEGTVCAAFYDFNVGKLLVTKQTLRLFASPELHICKTNQHTKTNRIICLRLGRHMFLPGTARGAREEILIISIPTAAELNHTHVHNGSSLTQVPHPRLHGQTAKVYILLYLRWWVQTEGL